MYYLSFKEKHKSRKLARIDGGEHNNEYIYLVEDPEAKELEFDDDDPLTDFKDDFISIKYPQRLDIKDGVIIPLPQVIENQRENIMISGPEGSGKSVWTSKYAKEYKKLFPKNKILIFSGVEEDEPLDKLNPIRIKLNDEIVKHPIKPKEISNTLCIFDDIENLKTKEINEAVQHIRDEILETGRHNNIYCMSLMHNPMSNKISKMSLLESKIIVLFCHSGDSYHTSKVLEKYVGLNKNLIKEFMSLPSRWIAITKRAPMYLLHEKGCILIK